MILLGVDIGGTRIKAGLVGEEGRVIARDAVNTPANLNDFKEAVTGIILKLVENRELPAGVGVGCKGIVNAETTEIEILPGTFQFLEGLRLANLVGLVLPGTIPVCADNDARVALAGEAVWGAARGLRNVVMLTLGTGVGGGVLAEGKILRGARGVAGHLGHVTVDPRGPVCYCGNHGCLETLFSARAIEAEALHALHRGCESVLTERFRDNSEALTCQAVFDAAAEGDDVARTILDRAIEKLGAALAGLLHAFDPEVVILGGQISEAGAMLFDPLRRIVAWRSKRLLGREVPIVPQQVADRSGIVGAAALVLKSNLL